MRSIFSYTKAAMARAMKAQDGMLQAMYEALTTVEEHVDALARKARKLPGEVVKQLYEYVEFLESVHGDRDDSEARRLMKKAKKARKMKLSGKRKADGA